ncbi:MAG: outer membrane beta-barrel protein, partial [Panacagrimonas sp.]
MRFTKVLISSAVVVAAFAGTAAFAADPAASGIAYSGAFDFSYDKSSNDAVVGHVFDTEDDAFVFHQANLSATKAFDGGVGVGVNLILGKDANVVSGDLLDGDDFDVTQAYISKAMGNLTLTGGRYVTLAGMEVINPSGNINASRSLLFALQPLVHEG